MFYGAYTPWLPRLAMPSSATVIARIILDAVSHANSQRVDRDGHCSPTQAFDAKLLVEEMWSRFDLCKRLEKIVLGIPQPLRNSGGD
jgi:hypothetical protein